MARTKSYAAPVRVLVLMEKKLRRDPLVVERAKQAKGFNNYVQRLIRADMRRKRSASENEEAKA